ncbi:hypothetical protein AMTRI_Chr08g206440 [Amborella trichopoda]
MNMHKQQLSIFISLCTLNCLARELQKTVPVQGNDHQRDFFIPIYKAMTIVVISSSQCTMENGRWSATISITIYTTFKMNYRNRQTPQREVDINKQVEG